MPWTLQKVGGRYFVVDDKGKRYSEKPMSKKRAVLQMHALYANEKKETLTKGGLPASAFLIVEDPQQVSTWHLPVKDANGKPDHRLMGGAWAALHGGYRGNKYEGPGKAEAIAKLRRLYASEEMETPAEKSFRVFKQADGLYRWVTISSSAFKDRDGEIVTEQALAEDVARCDASKSYGPLRWWHVGGWEAPDGAEKWETWKALPGVDIGTCDFNMLHGKMLIESGTFKTPEIGEAFANSKENLEVSIAFSHPRGEPGPSKEYKNIHRFERSLLPEGMASNLLTKYYVVKGESSMKTQEKLAALVAILRGKPDVAAQILSDAETVQKAAEAVGLEYKEVEDMLTKESVDTPSTEQTVEETMVAAEATAKPEVSATEQVAEPPVEIPAEVAEPPVAESTTAPAAKAAAPAATPAAPAESEEPDEIGDMSHEQLKNFVVDIVKQIMHPAGSTTASKEADQNQAMIDAMASLKSFSERIGVIETEIEAQKQSLLELTDARPVGIKQLQSRRPTESLSNIAAEAPVGPHMDDSFVSFMQGGK